MPKRTRPRSYEARNVVQAEKALSSCSLVYGQSPVLMDGLTYAQASLLDALEPTGERDASAAAEAFGLDKSRPHVLTRD